MRVCPLMLTTAACSLLLHTGCQTPMPKPDAPASVPRPPVQLFVAADAKPTAPAPTSVDAVGRPIGQIVAEATSAGARCEFFAADSKRLEELPKELPGSVSVFLPAGGGQDNYTFDAKGVVIRHQRSHGEDYDAGIWRGVP